MFVNIICLLAFAGISVALGWLTWRTWRRTNPIAKWGGAAGSGFLALIITLVTILILVGAFKAYMPRGNPVVEVDIAGTPEQIARGAHLANTVCAACHTVNDELPLSSGKDILEDVPMPLGSFTPLTLPPRGRWQIGATARSSV